jgi:hypothetical protein
VIISLWGFLGNMGAEFVGCASAIAAHNWLMIGVCDAVSAGPDDVITFVYKKAFQLAN